uniref:Fibronectin type-III domain-containing protein n=1 Tax=Amphimedon queenslandica TaxID=400682 RepID=A0A1X7ULF7_AMPQE
MVTFTYFAIFASLALFYFVEGTPQFTTCPSNPVCLSQPVTYECNSGAASLTWIVLDANGDSVGIPVGYSQFSPVGTTGSIGTQFNTVLINGTNSLGANITFTPTLSMSDYIVQCGGAGTLLVNCSIVIAGIPTPVENGAIAYGAPVSTYIRFSWVSSMSPCLSHYVLVVRSTSSMDDINYYNVSASSSTYTYLDLPLPSTNNTLYNFSVLAVDTGGRSSESIIRQIIFNVPGYVANLMLTQTDYPTDINNTVNITVSWNLQSYFSPIPGPLFYYIIYNVSDVPENTTVPQHISSRTLSGFTVGSEYTVGVAAVNPLGTGPTTTATITILATPPPPEIPSTSTSVASFTSGIRSTPSTTQTTPSVSATEGCNCASSTTLPIAVSVSVTFILTAILSSTLTLILTLLCVRSRSNKPVEQVELVEQAKRDEGGSTASVAVYDEITTTKGGATSSVPLTSNPAYGPLRN